MTVIEDRLEKTVGPPPVQIVEVELPRSSESEIKPIEEPTESEKLESRDEQPKVNVNVDETKTESSTHENSDQAKSEDVPEKSQEDSTEKSTSEVIDISHQKRRENLEQTEVQMKTKQRKKTQTDMVSSEDSPRKENKEEGITLWTCIYSKLLFESFSFSLFF